MAFRFLGNKAKLIPEILSEIELVAPNGRRSTVVDLFCGTGGVSLSLRKAGYKVIANDILLSCVTHARAQLLTRDEPQFSNLLNNDKALSSVQSAFLFDSPYHRVLTYLNMMDGMEGFFFNEYSPSGSPINGAPPRKYFTPPNAMKIDAIRSIINNWIDNNIISEMEAFVLLHNLMLATNRVANTAGTYGYFLADWTESAKTEITLRPSVFIDSPTDHRVIQGNAASVASKLAADVFYLDPPYTKRQYAAYYHILETIAYRDEPDLVGKSGLRPWEDRSSDFCYKNRALAALTEVLNNLDTNFAIISYSTDGHITHEEMMDLLHKYGQVNQREISTSRYKSKQGVSDNPLREKLYRVNIL